MSVVLPLLALCVVVSIWSWWVIRAGFPRRWRVPGRQRPVTSGPVPPDPPPALDIQVAWAAPAQVWPALGIENALLAARLTGRITPVEYRTRMLELARQCEPRSAAGSD
jgi:hypothetical protein